MTMGLERPALADTLCRYVFSTAGVKYDMDTLIPHYARADDLIEVRLVSDHEGAPSPHPEEIDVKELAKLMTQYRQALVGMVEAERPDIEEGDIVIGLVEVVDRSTGLRFRPSYPKAPDRAPVIGGAARRINDLVASGDFSSLPYQTQAGLHGMWKYVSQHGYAVELRVREGKSEWSGSPAARLTPQTEVPDPTHRTIEGVTTISGRIESVGGVKRAKVRIRTEPSKTISCTIPRVLAKSIASHLYTNVSVTGTAKWDADSLELVDFDVVQVTPYEGGSVREAFRELAAASGGAYDAVGDPVAFVRDLRGETDEV